MASTTSPLVVDFYATIFVLVVFGVGLLAEAIIPIIRSIIALFKDVTP